MLTNLIKLRALSFISFMLVAAWARAGSLQDTYQQMLNLANAMDQQVSQAIFSNNYRERLSNNIGDLQDNLRRAKGFARGVMGSNDEGIGLLINVSTMIATTGNIHSLPAATKQNIADTLYDNLDALQDDDLFNNANYVLDALEGKEGVSASSKSVRKSKRRQRNIQYSDRARTYLIRRNRGSSQTNMGSGQRQSATTYVSARTRYVPPVTSVRTALASAGNNSNKKAAPPSMSLSSLLKQDTGTSDKAIPKAPRPVILVSRFSDPAPTSSARSSARPPAAPVSSPSSGKKPQLLLTDGRADEPAAPVPSPKPSRNHQLLLKDEPAAPVSSPKPGARQPLLLKDEPAAPVSSPSSGKKPQLLLTNGEASDPAAPVSSPKPSARQPLSPPPVPTSSPAGDATERKRTRPPEVDDGPSKKRHITNTVGSPFLPPEDPSSVTPLPGPARDTSPSVSPPPPPPPPPVPTSSPAGEATERKRTRPPEFDGPRRTNHITKTFGGPLLPPEDPSSVTPLPGPARDASGPSAPSPKVEKSPPVSPPPSSVVLPVGESASLKDKISFYSHAVNPKVINPRPKETALQRKDRMNRPNQTGGRGGVGTGTGVGHA